MEITPSYRSSRSRSRSRTRNSTANSRATSATRRPSISSAKRSLSSSSLDRLTVTPTRIDSERSIPSVQVVLDNSLPKDFFKQDIIALAKILKISKWHKRNLLQQHLAITRISGALTNSIYKIEYNDDESDVHLPALLLRVYGKNVDELIDRDSELQILIKLSQKRIGPRLLGIFTNGRFEQFLDGFVTLNKEQIRNEVISQMIGRRMKDLHYKIELNMDDFQSAPTCWRLIEKWLKILEFEYMPQYEAAGINPKDVFFFNFQEFKKLVFKYKHWLFSKYDEAKEEFASNYKFCHNDTQYGNLLLRESFKPEHIIIGDNPNFSASNFNDVAIRSTSNKKDSDLVVIDFEYSGPNFPAFDIVNHFSEWMANYHDPVRSYYIDQDKYPTKLQQLNLIKSYIEYDFQFPSSNLKTSKSPIELSDNPKSQAINLIQHEIEKFYNECVYWRGSVQIYWCLWGLIQNGSLKPTLQVESTGEKGVDSTYNITVDIEKLSVDDSEVATQEAITSCDDDFDYLKYSNQKIAIFMGDAIQFKLIDENEIDQEYRKSIKYLSIDTFDY
ncbi:hypothetical protein KGF56_002150 [Candida oxycetoniae]|uniref:Choline kinase N-terminal domain-containing protein n=1 Tax=Candida oxycetoniae TaxID=497107 RepID=A0AAI9SYW8_9ASCO|nr:uncharacterized protein KGF56_002150 [Candida oxycetoniae]KAI3405065.2 hypothetical protein KGF56_002150 [Candida oxycetoniae]